MIAAGVIRTRTADALASRLLEISRGLRDVIARHEPDSGAVEEVFAAVNVRTALKLAHVRGVAMLAIAEAGLPCSEYSPLEIKTSVVGYGRAEKGQVQLMVRELLQVPVAAKAALESEDACDALAVAICHATTSFSAARMAMRAAENEVVAWQMATASASQASSDSRAALAATGT